MFWCKAEFSVTGEDMWVNIEWVSNYNMVEGKIVALARACVRERYWESLPGTGLRSAELLVVNAEGCCWEGVEAIARAPRYMDSSGYDSPEFYNSKYQVLCTSGKNVGVLLIGTLILFIVYSCDWRFDASRVKLHVNWNANSLSPSYSFCITRDADYVFVPTAMKVLEGVIKYRWNALPVEQRDGIKNYISDLIVQVH